jgi:hypothetical protein
MAATITQLAGDHVLAYEAGVQTDSSGDKTWNSGLNAVKVAGYIFKTKGTGASEPTVSYSGSSVSYAFGGSSASTFDAFAIGTV